MQELLYHYCSLESLLGIARNKCLWASDARFLNDKLEVKEAKNTIDSAIDLIVERLAEVPGHDQIIERLLKVWGENHLQFVISFSKAADNLSQWRSYGDRGKGVCIGFDRAQIAKLDHYLLDVIYGPDDLVEEVIKAAEGYAAKPNRQDADLDALEKRFVQMTALAKHDAFADEHEVRLLIQEREFAGDRKFRRSGQFLTSYREVDLSRVWLSGVLSDLCVGPNQHDDDTKWAIIQFLRESGSPSVNVHRSKVPFREW